MAREDFVYVNFDKGFMKPVDQVVKSATIHGTKKYRDRKDFIEKAIQNALTAELESKGYDLPERECSC